MKKPILILILFTGFISLFPVSGFAQKGYVSDMLLLTFREGPGNSFAVTKTITSNTVVHVLEEKNGFYKVELASSNEIGWVDKKFIIFTLPKALEAEQMEKQNSHLESTISTLKSQIVDLKEEVSSLRQSNTQTSSTLEDALKQAVAEKEKTAQLLSNSQQQYQDLIQQSDNIQDIIKENEVLQKENQRFSKELSELKTQNKTLFKTGMIKWFLSGAGVLLFGWIIGQSVSSKKRRSSSLLN